jgi:hypothetical protein
MNIENTTRRMQNQQTIDLEWEKFLKGDYSSQQEDSHQEDLHKSDNFPTNQLDDVELFISTKTKVLYLNQHIQIQPVFWNLPVSPYTTPSECIIKKQTKIESKTKEEYEEYRKKLENIDYYTEKVMKQIDNPTARRIKFKDERKISIGISKKDIMNCRGKVKGAFYNCFAMIFRIRLQDQKEKTKSKFHEVHVKIFNTGKLEIPGILNNQLLERVKVMILEYLSPHVNVDNPLPLAYAECKNKSQNGVLINSNFNCGFNIHREKMLSILRSKKYGIESAYDPCSYPGVKCKFYYKEWLGLEFDKQDGCLLEEDRTVKMKDLIRMKKYTAISFMIFRTGSCLIVGNCSESVLMFVFDFVKNILKEEYGEIYLPKEEEVVVKPKKTKLRKRTIEFTRV